MACKTCDQWERLYKSLKQEAERDREVCRELSLELDRMRDLHGTDNKKRESL